MRQAAYPALTAGAVATVAIVLVTTVLAHRFVRPIRQLGDRAAAIARGDFQPVAVCAPRRRDPRPGRLDQPDVRAAWPVRGPGPPPRATSHARSLGGGHGPSTAQRGHRRTHGDRAPPAGVRRGARPANRSTSPCGSCDLMESYLQRFMALGRDQPLAAENVCLSTVVEDALSLVRPACVHAGIDLEFVPPARAASGPRRPEALRQLTVNLVINAVEAAGRQSGRPAADYRRLGECAGRRTVRRTARARHGPRPAAGGGRPPVRAVRQRQAGRHRLGLVRGPAGRRRPSRLDPLATRERR